MLQIRKKVTFELLGAEYKDAYIVFSAVPVSEYDKYLEKVDKIEKDPKTKNRQGIKLMVDLLTEHFIEGKWPGSDTVTKDDIKSLNGEGVLHAFETVIGQNLPKAPESS